MISWNSGSLPGQLTSLMRLDHMLWVTEDRARIGSFIHFRSSFLKIKAVAIGPDPAFLPPCLCSLIFCPKREGKSTFPSCLLFTAMLPPAQSFFHPTEPLSLSLPSSSGEGKGKKAAAERTTWWLGLLTLPFPDNLKNTSKSSILYVANNRR